MAAEPDFNIKVDAVIVEASIGALKVTPIFVFKATSRSLFAGLDEITVGNMTAGGNKMLCLVSSQPEMIISKASKYSPTLNLYFILFIITPCKTINCM